MSATDATCPVPIEARCISCGYSLAHLAADRCPECGRAFNPTDPKTMWLGRPLTAIGRFFIAPVGQPVRWAILVCCGAILWGIAWLPGALRVTWVASPFLLAFLGYASARGIVRLILRRCFPNHVVSASRADRPLRFIAVMLMLVFASAFFDLPLALNLLISKPFFEKRVVHAYADEPMLDAKLDPGWYGLLLVDRVSIGPAGVDLEVAGGGAIEILEEDGKYVVHVAPRWAWYPPWPVLYR